MPFCSNCGKEVPENATFCPNCGAPVKSVERVAETKTVVLASWGTRFVAWLIDIVIVGAFLSLLALFITWPSFSWLPSSVPREIPFVDFGPRTWMYFLYWMLADGVYGQSIGRMIMGIKITRLDGTPIGMGQAAIESIGKAFLLLIDFLLGYFLYPSRRQRVFNYLSNTIIVHK